MIITTEEINDITNLPLHRYRLTETLSDTAIDYAFSRDGMGPARRYALSEVALHQRYSHWVNLFLASPWEDVDLKVYLLQKEQRLVAYYEFEDHQLSETLARVKKLREESPVPLSQAVYPEHKTLFVYRDGCLLDYMSQQEVLAALDWAKEYPKIKQDATHWVHRVNETQVLRLARTPFKSVFDEVLRSTLSEIESLQWLMLFLEGVPMLTFVDFN